MPDLFWNSNKLFEQDLKILEICAQYFKNCCTHSGGCSFFEDFTHIHKEQFAQYVWLEADRVFSTEELDNLSKEYLTIKNNDVRPPPFVNSKEAHALETIYRADTNIEPNEKGLIEYDKKTYLRKLFFNGKFLDIPKDWNQRQTNLFMSSPTTALPLSEQFKELNVSKVLKLQNVTHLERQQEYFQEKGNSLKTIHLIWPTSNIPPRAFVLDPFCISWMLLFGKYPNSPYLSFAGLTDNLKTVRNKIYITSDKTKEQVLIVECSYANALEISEEKFTEMRQKFAHTTQAFWDTTDLAGIDLSSVDLLIVKLADGNRFYLPRNISKQILPSHFVDIERGAPKEIEVQAEEKVEEPSTVLSSTLQSVSSLIEFFTKKLNLK